MGLCRLKHCCVDVIVSPWLQAAQSHSVKYLNGSAIIDWDLNVNGANNKKNSNNKILRFM